MDTDAIVPGSEVPLISRRERRAQTESIKIIPTGRAERGRSRSRLQQPRALENSPGDRPADAKWLEIHLCVVDTRQSIFYFSFF